MARKSQVTHCLSGGHLVNARSNENPNIFCNDQFAEEVEYAWEQFAKDATGAEMITGQHRRGRKTGITIEEVYPHIQDIAPGTLPWWCPELGGYTFSTGLIESLCAKEGRQALTSRADAYPSTVAGSSLGLTYANFNRHVLLFPSSLTPAGTDSHSQPSVAGLVTSANYPALNDNRLIDKFGTVSCTLYHEMFHPVDSAGTDRDGPDERDANGKLIQYYAAKTIILANMAGAAQIVNAPEPYVLIALAAYMYRNPPAGKTGLFFVPNVG
ncbi:hypothetical protein BDW59DRAFT_157655 [Aspergillus cavernicola]|uniref:Lysine-specific metallo-endopeptidase domain-containing protein n=1 Tax=Aspergillus cavernicola TaxID=176166 RepID=A0ABR4IWM1_9EURO